VLCRRRIAQRYLRGLFTFDFLTNFPFLIGLEFNLDPHSPAYHFVKLLTLCRIFRLTTFAEYCCRMLKRLGVDEKYLEILKLLLYWIICIHWAACLHIIPGIIAARFRPGELVGAWYEHKIFQRHDKFGKYVICLFKAVKTIMGTGYIKDLQPRMPFDHVFASSLTIVGRIALCVTLAYIFELIQGVRSSSLRYDEMMVQLSKYTAKNKLPESTKVKLRRNYDSTFRKRYFNQREILQTVCGSLRQQILVHSTRQLVDNSPFFENLPSALVLKIISALSVELYLEGDVIYSFGEVGTCVYFITSGSVAFYSPSGLEVCHFSDGDYFGEMTLVSDVEHRYGKVVALETTECYK
jgi:Cyclic nucleotide-binding domain